MTRNLGAGVISHLDEVDRPNSKVKRDQGLGIRCLNTLAPGRFGASATIKSDY